MGMLSGLEFMSPNTRQGRPGHSTSSAARAPTKADVRRHLSLTVSELAHPYTEAINTGVDGPRPTIAKQARP